MVREEFNAPIGGGGQGVKAAEHRRVADSLATTASNLPTSGEGLVELPLHLDLLPALLQYLIAMRTGIEEHVAYQSPVFVLGAA